MTPTDDRPTAGPGDVPPPRDVHAPAGTPAGPWYAGPLDAPDRYELSAVGLTGGEGTLYRARYRGGLQNPLEFAVKAMHRPRRADAGWPRDEDQRQWQDQTALLRHLDVKHLVRVHEVFAGPPPHPAAVADPRADRTIAYAAMEWVDGPTLAEQVRGLPVGVNDLDTRIGYVADLADAVATLHSATRTGGNPSLHRDVKPTNCIVHRTRGVVLVDVSSMRLLADGFDPDGMHSPGYSAPEVLASPHMPRSTACDLFSLGAIMAFCLLGEDPPTAPKDLGALGRRLTELARRAGAGRPDDLANLVLAMLDPDPSRRPADPLAWARRLAVAAEPVRRRRRVAVAAAAGVLVVGAAAAFIEAPRDDAARVRANSPLVSSSTGAAAGSAPGATAGTSGSSTSPVTASTTPPPKTSRPVSVTTGSPSGAVPAGQKPVGSTSTSRTTKAKAQPGPQPKVSSLAQSVGSFSSPVEGADVQACSYFSGTATVPADATLVLTKRNLDNGDSHRYVEFALGWDKPSATARWRGHQYFGDNDAAAGQRFAIELIAVRRSLVVAADSGPDADADALAGKGKVLDTMNVVRVPGGSPDTCP